MDTIYILVLIANGAAEPSLIGPFDYSTCNNNVEIARNAAFEANLVLVAACLPLNPVTDGFQ